MLIALLVACLAAIVLLGLLIRQTSLTSEAEDDAAQWRRKQMSATSEASDLRGQLDSATHNNKSLKSAFVLSRAAMYRAVRHQTILRRELGSMRRRVKTAETDLNTAERKIVDLAAQPSYVADSIQQTSSNNAESLWRLEKLRSERLWRANVAINPMMDQSPFDDCDDIARLCVEVEAASLREEVGADTTIDWQASPIEDAGRAHLLVRVAHELLAVASQTPAVRKTLIVVSEPELAVSLEAEKGVDIDLTNSDLSGELLESAATEGVQVSVKA